MSLVGFALLPAFAVIYIGCRNAHHWRTLRTRGQHYGAPAGAGRCPWDREQTFDSIKPYTLEETYEVIEAIDNRDWPELAGELGDLLLQVLFYAEMAKEQDSFSIDDVLDRLVAKLINRHPHVFGDVKADTSVEVKRNWEAIKVEERKTAGCGSRWEDGAWRRSSHSVLAGVSSAMPSLLEAHKLSSRAAQAGFDWPNIEGLFDKLREETDELREQLKEFPAPGPRPQARGMAGSGRTVFPEKLQARLEDEVGDLFFVLVNIARYLRSILNLPCARRTENSSVAFSGWRPGCASPAGRPIRRPWKSSNRSGSRPRPTNGRPRRSPCERGLGGPSPLPRTGRTAGLRRPAERSWNFTDAELVPLRMFVVADKVGGQVMGAFEGDHMVGFALSVPGTRSGHIYLHSHMLAVRKDHRNGGLGRRLKLLQREDALARGIDLIEWTFDPLEIKNAYLNIEKLGAIARRYNINQYGITSSPLQGGLPSDRLIAEWWLKSKRVETLLGTGKNPAFASEASIAVPAEIYEWKAAAETRGKARRCRSGIVSSSCALSRGTRRAGVRARRGRQRQVRAGAGMKNGRMRRKAEL